MVWGCKRMGLVCTFDWHRMTGISRYLTMSLFLAVMPLAAQETVCVVQKDETSKAIPTVHALNLI